MTAVLDALREGRTVVYGRGRDFGDPALIEFASDHGGLPAEPPVLPAPGTALVVSRTPDDGGASSADPGESHGPNGDRCPTALLLISAALRWRGWTADGAPTAHRRARRSRRDERRRPDRSRATATVVFVIAGSAALVVVVGVAAAGP
jgi:hypothetical protein